MIDELRLDKGKAYITNWLYLPKDKVVLSAIRAALTIRPATGLVTPGNVIVAYKELADHIRVPRAFVTSEWMTYNNVPCQDLRPSEDSYDYVDFKSTVVPRDFEQEAAMKALFVAPEGGILEMGCGRGKSVQALHTISQLKKPALIIVNNTTHIDQWIAESQKCLGVTPTVVQGAKHDWSNLTIAMLHTLAGREWDVNDLNRFGSVWFDEAHHLSAPTFNVVCPLFVGKRFGLTATKHREDGTESLYLYHLGPVLYTDMRTDLVPEVFFIKTGERFNANEVVEVRSSDGVLNIPKIRSALALRDSRNALILSEIKKAREQERRILVLGHVVSHLQALQQACPDSGLCTGAVPPKTRHKILKEYQVIFSTTNLAAEGLNAPWLDTLFLITPFKARGLFQQAVGRILRKCDNKKDPVVVVFQDEFKPLQAMLAPLKKYLKERNIDFHIIFPD